MANFPFQRLQADLAALIERTPAGARLISEPDLAKQLGVSRATLREAMRTFETQGLIRRRQGAGTFVVGKVPVIDAGLEVLDIQQDNRIGAVASFVGQVRDVPMTLEHYPGMTENAIKKIVEEARAQWEIMDYTVIHRYGDLQPNDQIVLVAIASSHRADAFAACQFIMDFLKTQAPFWKKEHHPEGARWVNALESDDQAAERWRKLKPQQRLIKP